MAASRKRPRKQAKARTARKKAPPSFLDALGETVSRFASAELPAGLKDARLRKEITSGMIGVLLDLYSAAQDHRKRALEIEEKLHALVRSTVRHARTSGPESK